MTRIIWLLCILIAAVSPLLLSACNSVTRTSDEIQRAEQERILAEGTSQVGMPAIKNFREKKLLKDILELRDQKGLVTYTYIFSEQRGCLVFLGNTVGYPLPYATQFTNPQKVEASGANYGYAILPQADPNGLFSPESAEGTWILMKDPHGAEIGVVYSEPRLLALPFRVDESCLCK